MLLQKQLFHWRYGPRGTMFTLQGTQRRLYNIMGEQSGTHGPAWALNEESRQCKGEILLILLTLEEKKSGRLRARRAPRQSP